MKKFYLFLLAVLTVASLAISCKKDNTKPADKDKDTETVSNDPQDGGDDAVITIGGDFSDWDNLDGVAECELDEDTGFSYPGLLCMKAIADEDYLYIYFQYQLQRTVPQAEEGEEGGEEGGETMSKADEEEDYPFQTSAPFNLFVNIDNDPETGYTSYIWSKEGCGYEKYVESEMGFLADATSTQHMTDMKVYQASGADGADAWDPDGGLDDLKLSDFFEDNVSLSNGVATVECSVLRSAIECNKPGKIAIGLIIYNGDIPGWDETGVLPQGATAGSADLLEVVLP